MHICSMNWEPEIVYKDLYVCIVNKPFGLLSQKDKKGEEGVNELLFKYLNKPNFWVMLQRIDRMAGGLMSIATSKRMANAMRQMQIDQQISKTYYIITERKPHIDAGRMEQFIKKLPKVQRWKIFEEEVEGGKSAILEYEVLSHINGRSLIKVKPITGRTHQIRAQMANIGCPVVGDKKYGKTEWLSDMSICLFSQRIEFKHPLTGDEIAVEAKLPIDREGWTDFKEVILNLNL
ncbi:hypothetical protein GC194_08440 [bacterium]|nr:hypothetical protein [bacterium]